MNHLTLKLVSKAYGGLVQGIFFGNIFCQNEGLPPVKGDGGVFKEVVGGKELNT